MFTIVQRGGSTREKPPEVVRGYSSRLPWAWDGLCFAVPFNNANQLGGRELVTGIGPTGWFGTPTWGRDDRGNAALQLPGDSYLEYPSTPTHDRPSTEITVGVRMRRTGTPGAGGVGIFDKVYSPGADPWISWGLQCADVDLTQLGANLTVNGTLYYGENSTYSTDTTTWISVFLRWRSGDYMWSEVLGERGQVLSFLSTGSPVSGTITYAATPQPIRINMGDTPGVGYTAAYSQVMLWSRRLTDTEVQALVADPYGWYSPRRETIGLSSPYPLVAGQGVMREVSSG